MPVQRNNGRGPKVITYRLASEEGDSELYALTFRMARGLLSTVEYFQWMSRHLTLPTDLSDQQALNDWVDNLRQRLMEPFDPLAEICSRIINCIESDTDVQDALRDFVLGDQLINEAYDNKNIVAGKGSPLLPEELIGNPEEYNELWAQCVQLVEYTDQAINQLLEVLEVQSNNIELIKNSMNSIPMFKFVLDAVPVNSWLEFADYFLDVIGEQYASGYDETIPTGSKWILCCKLFCLCKPTKEVTIEKMWDAITSLLSGYAVPSWDNAQELVESLIGVNDNSTVVAYSCFGLMWGIAKLSSFLGLSSVTNTALGVILEIAKNDANDDHETLCLECPPDPVVGCTDMMITQGDWLVLDSGTSWLSGSGFKGSFYAPIYWIAQIKLMATTDTFSKIVIRLNNAADEVRLTSADHSITFMSYSGTPKTEIEFSAATVSGWTNLANNLGIGFRVQWNNNDASDRIIEVCLTVV